VATTEIVEIIAAVCGIAGMWISHYVQSRNRDNLQDKEMQHILEKIDTIEHKVEKHNNFIERLVKQEAKTDENTRRIDNLERVGKK
jgi:predicted transcriptional regulator